MVTFTHSAPPSFAHVPASLIWESQICIPEWESVGPFSSLRLHHGTNGIRKKNMKKLQAQSHALNLTILTGYAPAAQPTPPAPVSPCSPLVPRQRELHRGADAAGTGGAAAGAPAGRRLQGGGLRGAKHLDLKVLLGFV